MYLFFRDISGTKCDFAVQVQLRYVKLSFVLSIETFYFRQSCESVFNLSVLNQTEMVMSLIVIFLFQFISIFMTFL